MPYIAETTVKSLRLRLYASALTLASATSFIVVHGTRPFLVTNHHVVTGLNQITGEFMAKHAAHPEMVEISHHKLGQVGQHVMLSEPLYDQAGRGRRLEHPAQARPWTSSSCRWPEPTAYSFYPHDPWKTEPPIALNVKCLSWTVVELVGDGVEFAAKLNRRPRKTLGFKNPAEVLDKELIDAGDALTA